MYTIVETLREKNGALLFYVALVLFLISSPLVAPEALPETWGRALLALKYMATLLCLAGTADPRYALTCFSLFIIFFISSRLGQGNNLTYTFLLAAASRDSDSSVTLRIYLCFFFLLLILNNAMYFAGLSEGVTKHWMGLSSGSFGFANPNTFAYFLMMLTFLLFCMSDSLRKPVLIFAVSWAVAITVFLITLSKTSTIILLAFPLVWLFIDKVKPSAALTAALPAAALIFSVLVAAAVAPGYGENTFLSRFSIPHLSYDIYGLSWLGHDSGHVLPQSAMHQGFTEPLCLDNLFLFLPLAFGIIPALVYMAFVSCLLYRFASSGRTALLAVTVCVVISSLMESYPLYFTMTFPLMLFFDKETESDSRFVRALCPASIILASAILLYIHFPWPIALDKEESETERISDIPAPSGYERTDIGEDGYMEFLRSLPLASEDTPVMYYEKAELPEPIVPYCYRVVDFPLVSVSEQCADACMHLRAEYLYRKRRFGHIHFEDAGHHVMRYPLITGRLHDAYRNYLFKVFDRANTESLRNEMVPRACPGEVEVGDVWCYDVHSRDSVNYGHAMMVADVAVDATTGEKIVLLVQGSTPACNIHVVRNTLEPEISPWFRLGNDGEIIDFGFARYKPDELYHF